MALNGNILLHSSANRQGFQGNGQAAQKGERLIRGASTSGLASEEPPGRPGNGWRGLSALDSGSAALRQQA